MSLTDEQYHEAARRVLHACTIMGGARCSIDRYIALFGIPGLDRQTMFGTHIDHGLVHLFDEYNFRIKFECKDAQQYLGWFLCLCKFSRENAQLPALNDDKRYYPAVFAQWYGYDHVLMACEAILLQQSRPWWVHKSRVCFVKRLSEARAEAGSQMQG